MSTTAAPMPAADAVDRLADIDRRDIAALIDTITAHPGAAAARLGEPVYRTTRARLISSGDITEHTVPDWRP